MQDKLTAHKCPSSSPYSGHGSLLLAMVASHGRWLVIPSCPSEFLSLSLRSVELNCPKARVSVNLLHPIRVVILATPATFGLGTCHAHSQGGLLSQMSPRTWPRLAPLRNPVRIKWWPQARMLRKSPATQSRGPRLPGLGVTGEVPPACSLQL